jgi:hypothetical protein
MSIRSQNKNAPRRRFAFKYITAPPSATWAFTRLEAPAGGLNWSCLLWAFHFYQGVKTSTTPTALSVTTDVTKWGTSSCWQGGPQGNRSRRTPFVDPGPCLISFTRIVFVAPLPLVVHALVPIPPARAVCHLPPYISCMGE